MCQQNICTSSLRCISPACSRISCRASSFCRSICIRPYRRPGLCIIPPPSGTGSIFRICRKQIPLNFTEFLNINSIFFFFDSSTLLHRVDYRVFYLAAQVYIHLSFMRFCSATYQMFVPLFGIFGFSPYCAPIAAISFFISSTNSPGAVTFTQPPWLRSHIFMPSP